MQYDQQRAIFSRLFATATTQFASVDDGVEFPQSLPIKESFVVEGFFCDLQRCSTGSTFHERNDYSSLIMELIAGPFYGGTTVPYGRDGEVLIWMLSPSLCWCSASVQTSV